MGPLCPRFAPKHVNLTGRPTKHTQTAMPVRFPAARMSESFRETCFADHAGYEICRLGLGEGGTESQRNVLQERTWVHSHRLIESVIIGSIADRFADVVFCALAVQQQNN